MDRAGVPFTAASSRRAQFCFYFDAGRWRAHRFVKALKEQQAAAENENFMFSGGSRPCRILSKPIYRALGIENIRHWRKARPAVVMRRLLSLDYILKHPELVWLPTEAEKVDCFEGYCQVNRFVDLFSSLDTP